MKSPVTPSLQPERGLTRSGKKRKEPFWKTAPVGMTKRGNKRQYIRRRTRPTAGEIDRGKLVGANWNLIFTRRGYRTARTYEVTYTSPLDPAKSFRVRVAASSLRQLFREATCAIGNLRATHTVRNFTVNFLAVTEKEGIVEEIVHVPMAKELPQEERPSTDEPFEPIVVEE